jgi:MFS family permease
VEGKGIKKQSYIFLVTFCFIWGIWDINVFRYTTAALMFLTGLLPYLVDKKKHYLWISVLSIFMHFSFVLPLVVFVIFSIFGDRTNFYFFIFLIGLFISEIDLAAIRDAATILPAAFQEKTNEYANEEFVEYRDELDQEKVWYAVYYQKSLRWVTSAILIYWYWLYRRNRFYTKKLQLLFSFSLLFYGVFLILTGIPVMKRFLFTGSLFVFALQFIYLQTAFFNRFLKLFVIISILPLLFFCVVKSRIALVFISANSIFGNPVSSILSPEWDSLLIFFKNLL